MHWGIQYIIPIIQVTLGSDVINKMTFPYAKKLTFSYWKRKVNTYL